MLGKLLLLVLVAWLVYVLLKRYRRSMSPPDDAKAAQDMVCCAVCGVHLPKSESLLRDGTYYCSESHRDQVT